MCAHECNDTSSPGSLRRAAAYTQLDRLRAPNGAPWPATPVRPGQLLKFLWALWAPHRTARFTVWCTRQGWDWSTRLERADFSLTPILRVDYPATWPDYVNPGYSVAMWCPIFARR